MGVVLKSPRASCAEFSGWGFQLSPCLPLFFLCFLAFALEARLLLLAPSWNAEDAAGVAGEATAAAADTAAAAPCPRARRRSATGVGPRVWPMGTWPPCKPAASSITPPLAPTTSRLPDSTTALDALDVLVVVSTGTCMRRAGAAASPDELLVAGAAPAKSVSSRRTPDTLSAWQLPSTAVSAGIRTTESDVAPASESSSTALTCNLPVPATPRV